MWCLCFQNVRLLQISIYCKLQLKCDGTRWRAEGEVKGKLANGVGSQYPSHYLGTWCIRHYYSWCVHLGCTVVDWTDAPRRFKWIRPFRRKPKFGFCACAITFQTQSNNINAHKHACFTYLCPQSQANGTCWTPEGGWYRVCPPPTFDPIHWMFMKFYVNDLLLDSTFEPYR
jgi:hypothetical protein